MNPHPRKVNSLHGRNACGCRGLFCIQPIQHTIYLKSREFVPETTDLDTVQRLAIAGEDRMHVLLQLDFIPRQAAKAEFEARGIQLLAYVPDYAWIASVPAANPAMALQQPGVTWAGALAVEDKLDPAIIQDVWGSYNLAPDGTAAVYVALHPRCQPGRGTRCRRLPMAGASPARSSASICWWWRCRAATSGLWLPKISSSGLNRPRRR